MAVDSAPKNNIESSETLTEFSSYNEFILRIKNTICESLLNGESVLLNRKRFGLDYSCKTDTNKPFEDIQQIYMQQIRKNNKFKSPYFMPFHYVVENGFDIDKEILPTVLTHINKTNSKIDFTNYYNGDQLSKNNNTLDIANNLLNTELEVPYIKQNIIPPVKTYKPKSFSLIENFKFYLSEYFKSIYSGPEYNPPKYTKEELNKICSYIKNSNYFKDVKEAHKPVKNSLLTPVKLKKHDHSRKL